MFKTIFVLCALVLTVASQADSPAKNSKRAQCYVSKMNLTLAEGDELVLGNSGTQCMMYKCTKDYLEITGCGVTRIHKGCDEVRENQVYPYCCSKEVC